MTAFNSIKTNNWPAASNDLEDFLVLELPLNDQAALTSSRRDIVAGSTVLHPKRTLTNTGVLSSATGPNYSALISGSVDSNYPLSNLFGGTIGTGYTNGTRSTAPGTLTLDLSSLNITVTNVRLNTYIYQTPGTFQVNGTDVGGSWGSADQTHVIAVNGQLNTIAWSYDSIHGPYCYMRGIEVDYGDGNGYQLLTDAPGGTKKHYDNNATFTTSHLATTADEALALNGDQWTVEFWINPDSGMVNEACPVRAGTNYSTDKSPYLGYLSGTNWQLYMSSGTGASWDIAGGNNFGSLTVGTWKHYAIVRNGSSFKAYENGTETLNLTRNVGDVYQATNSWSIGKAFTSSGYFKGAIQDLRFYKGVAKYTANFTPPPAILG